MVDSVSVGLGKVKIFDFQKLYMMPMVLHQPKTNFGVARVCSFHQESVTK